MSAELTLSVALSAPERDFLLIACGMIPPASSRSRPGAADLTAEGVLALRERLRAAPVGGGLAVPVDMMQRVRASELKSSIADTYAAADRGPVAIMKARGTGAAKVTHVLISVDHYQAMLARPCPQPRSADAGRESFIVNDEDGPVVGILIDLADGSQIWTGEFSELVLQESARNEGSPRASGQYLGVSAKGGPTRVLAEVASVDVGIALARAMAGSRGTSIAPDPSRHILVGFAPPWADIADGGAPASSRTLPPIAGPSIDYRAAGLDRLTATTDEDAVACGICDVLLITGDRCLEDISLGTVHAACCGPERECYVNLTTGEPIAADAPLPQPWPWMGDAA